MSQNIHELIEQTYARYEVLPYYLVQEEPHGTAKRIQAGFDIQVYGVKPSLCDTLAGVMYSAAWLREVGGDGITAHRRVLLSGGHFVSLDPRL